MYLSILAIHDQALNSGIEEYRMRDYEIEKKIIGQNVQSVYGSYVQ